MGSLRARVAGMWGLLAAVCAAMLAILLLAQHAGPSALIRQADATTRASCEAIRTAVDRLIPADDDGSSGLLEVVVDLSLRDAYGVEGGVWSPAKGFVAYAYPTYEGVARKTDMPAAEADSITAQARQVDATARPLLSEVRQGEREAVALAVCALPKQQVGWTLTRVAAGQAALLQRIVLAAALALGVVALVGAWLLAGLRQWSRKLSALEGELAARTGERERVGLKGEPDLDRLVQAFNASAERIETLGATSEALGRELAQAERLSALGRVAAGLAHEIRNPLGSMRLRAENALAVEGAAALERRTGALHAVLHTVDRVDGLVTSLLNLTRPMRLTRQPARLDDWLREAIELRSDQARVQGIRLEGRCEAGLVLPIDAPALARALDNLLLNALQHTPAGGSVTVDVAVEAGGEGRAVAGAGPGAGQGAGAGAGAGSAPGPDRGRVAPAICRMTVDDTGPGVAEAMRPQLFEPFATSRAEGTGLGLATAFEIVAGHGGSLACSRAPGGGARFEMRIPWPAS